MCMKIHKTLHTFCTSNFNPAELDVQQQQPTGLLIVMETSAKRHRTCSDHSGETVADGTGLHEPQAQSSTPTWEQTIHQVSSAIVVLKTTGARAFDTEAAGSSSATGFVVDRERGLILTNRHVVLPGPVVAEAVFQNREEVAVRALYRDPVHDFGFFRFDPAQIRFMQIGEVPLVPEAARVGLEVRVVGNDSGEKLSILSATLARLDRDAPAYSKDGYNDFNTFYMQAASGTKGGSSGSPVVDVLGQAVGLNAGSKSRTNAAFFLPLHRVLRALHALRSCCPPEGPGAAKWLQPCVPRGTLQTVFKYAGFDEARRLGLRPETEAAVRSEAGPEVTGMLVVDSVVPGGPAHTALEAGDVVVRLNGQVLRDFIRLEGELDSAVKGHVEMVVERGGTEMSCRLQVDDLHSISPAKFLEVCSGVLHALSYQQARNFCTEIGKCYVAEAGHVLGHANVPKHAIITSLNKVDTPTVEDFAREYAKLKEGARAPLQYYVMSERHRKRTTLLYLHGKWFPPPAWYLRDDTTGLWERQTLPQGGKDESGEVVDKVHREELAADPDTTADTAPPFLNGDMNMLDESGPTDAEVVAKSVEPSLCLVQVHVPSVAPADGVHAKSFVGGGVVLRHDARAGLVLVDRNTVPIASCDILLSFAAHPSEVPGQCVFLHPTHNFAFVRYNPAHLPAAANRALRALRLKPRPALQRGQEVVLLGLSETLRITARVSRVTDANQAVAIPVAEVPRFRAVNEEVIELDMDFGFTFSGVLTDARGEMVALWASYAKQVKGEEREFVRGIPVSLVLPALDQLNQRLDAETASHEGALNNAPFCVRLLDVELETVLLSKAVSFGLPPHWAALLQQKDPVRKQVLRIRGRVKGTVAAELLEEGDMLLRVGGGVGEDDAQNKTDNVKAEYSADTAVVPTCFMDVERAADSWQGDQGLPMTVWRQGAITHLAVPLSHESCEGTGRLLHWAGLQLQETHRAVRETGFMPEQRGVFISRWHHGSPAHRYGLYALNWITAVNGVATPDLDTFVEVAKVLEHGSFVRLALVSLNTKKKVLSLKLDLHYWPTWELRREQNDFSRHML